MITINTHSHTKYSDGANSVKEMIQSSKDKGIKILALTDHFQSPTLHENVPFKQALTLDKLDKYLNEIEDSKIEGIHVLKGLEVEYTPEYEHEIIEILKNPLIDITLCSIHFIDGVSIDNTDADFEKNIKMQNGVKNLYTKYYMQLKQAINSAAFDCYAHIDLLKMLNVNSKFYEENDPYYQELIFDCIKLIKKTDKALELNLKGFDRPIKSQYPSEFFLKKAKEIDVDFCIGVDAHNKEDVARHLDKAETILKRLAIKRICYFEKRKKKFIEI